VTSLGNTFYVVHFQNTKIPNIFLPNWSGYDPNPCLWIYE